MNGVAWRPMDTAPRDGTVLRLLVEFTEHATEDSPDPAPTIGANNFDNTGEDEWQFAGWCWTHDHFTQGKGKPVGWLPMVDDASDGIGIIAAERRRQVEVEGWTPKHDDEHETGELAMAASVYARMAGSLDGDRNRLRSGASFVPMFWPWRSEWWKPSIHDGPDARIRELTKAGALIAAEIDRLKRVQARDGE